MSLPAPILDDRTFQQLVDEVRKRIPLYCPEWTDHNLSDPGITLVELFAWMTELLIYRLNRVPELHYIKFMEFLGYQRRSPVAAQTWTTFWLSRPLTEVTDPDNQGLVIQAGVEVATTQTETISPIVFAVKEDFVIRPPTLKALVIERVENNQPQPRALQTGEFVSLRDGLAGINLFSQEPRDNEAIYFGFDNHRGDLSYHILNLTLRIESKAGIGVNTDHPPYVWEVYNADGDWQELKRAHNDKATAQTPDTLAELNKDTTRALNDSGEVTLLLPKLGKTTLVGQRTPLHWVRVRLVAPTPTQEAAGMRRFKETPYLRQVVQVASLGASIAVANERIVYREVIGESDGSPGQRFTLAGKPVLLPLQDGECLRVKNNEFEDHDGELWHYVDHFAASDERSQHFTLDSLSGELRFGPAVRQPDGAIKLYGKTPPRGARLIFERYRYMGGLVADNNRSEVGNNGNVPINAINILRTSIPYVDHVENRLPATGGMGGQSVEAAQIEVQRLIRTRKLAITPDDYEARVLEQFIGQIGRVKCLPITTDAKQRVRVLLIPIVTNQRDDRPYGYLTNADLHVLPTLLGEVDAYLNYIRMLTVQVKVENYTYRRARVVVRLRLREGARREVVEQNALRRLHAMLHPLTGSENSAGWPFERTLTVTDINKWLAIVAGVQAVEQVELQEVEDVGPARTADNEQRIRSRPAEIRLQPGEMLVSGHHQVICQ
ncbi:MAG: putative baseplate assembly protein [Caldilineaceae bacterium]